MGIATAASGVAGTLGQAQSQQSAADAQYAANKAQRQSIINNQRSRLTLDTARYNTRKGDRQRQDISATRAADKAYLGNQNAYNDKVKSFMSSKQQRMIESLTAGATMGAKGQRGGSMEMMQVANDAALGRDSAMALASLRSASTNLISSNRDIKDKLQGEYDASYSRVGNLPTQGFTPPEAVKPAGPNPLSIAAALGSSVLGGVTAFQQAGTLSDGTTQRQAGGGGQVFNPSAPPLFSNSYSQFNYG